MPKALWTVMPWSPRIDIVVSGVGKANAAGCVAKVADPAIHIGLVSLGIGGALPGSGLDLGQPVVGTISLMGDEGIETPAGYQTCEQMGFPQIASPDQVRGFDPWVQQAESEGLVARTIATVSTCSGTDLRARQIAERTGASVEAMEGAAVGLVAVRLGLPFLEVRVISNTTGDRAGQVWDLAGAKARLRPALDVLARLVPPGR